MIRFALAQINPWSGHCDHNIEQIETAIHDAHHHGADWIVFSELVVTGYPIYDTVWALQPAVDAAVTRLLSLSHQFPAMHIVVGLPVYHESGVIANAAVVICNGQIQHGYAKHRLPNHDIFFESRYFQPGGGPTIIEDRGVKIGITICEDAWGGGAVEPIASYASADIILNLSASPYGLEKYAQRLQQFGQVAKACQATVVMVNQVGGCDGVVFDGRSFCLDKTGQVVHQLPAFEPALSVYQWDPSSPLVPMDATINELDAMAGVHEALVLGIREYIKKSKLDRIVVAVSGGIDSAVVTALAVDAVGRERVHGLALPGHFSSEGSITDAVALADNLGINMDIQPITDLVDTVMQQTTAVSWFNSPNGLVEENVQARARGLLTMAYANQQPGTLVLATGNKSELAVGYCTAYGDMCGGLAPIGDLYKTQVYALAQYMNRVGVRIPESTVAKSPSAELKPNQVDQDTLPDYAVLDAILMGVVESGQSETQLVQAGYDTTTVAWVIRMLGQSEYKRQQAAPVIKVSTRSFDWGWRHVMAS